MLLCSLLSLFLGLRCVARDGWLRCVFAFPGCVAHCIVACGGCPLFHAFQVGNLHVVLPGVQSARCHLQLCSLPEPCPIHIVSYAVIDDVAETWCRHILLCHVRPLEWTLATPRA